MSNEKLEALKWRLGTVNRFEGSQAVDGPKGELFGRSWATSQTMACGFVVTHNDQIAAAHALGVEEGKLDGDAEALALALARIDRLRQQLRDADAENKRLREAAPVDDGRRFEVGSKGCEIVCATCGEKCTDHDDEGCEWKDPK